VDNGDAQSRWRISSESKEETCVEVLLGEVEVVVRHSKRPEGARIVFSKAEWAAFVLGVKKNEFDAIFGDD
jgi:Domain of unknown function (DUF397)